MERAQVRIDELGEGVGFDEIVEQVVIEKRNHLVNDLEALGSDVLRHVILVDEEDLRQ